MRQSDVGQTQTQFTQIRNNGHIVGHRNEVANMNRDLMLIITPKDEIQMKFCQ